MALFGSAALLVVAGVWMQFGRRRAADEAGPKDDVSGASPRALAPWQTACLLAILVTAFGVRFEGLERRSMTHVEVYVPGLDLPAGISEPPRRVGLAETIAWHVHDEPHPQGYYFFMWGWTRVFGTSLMALRLPSAIAGVAAAWLLFLLTTRLFGATAGLLAAAMLALNGFQVFWGQNARMYAPSLALALASSTLLASLLEAGPRRVRREVGYVAVTWLMLFTQLISWGLLAGQILTALRYARTARQRLPRALELQALVVMLGAPLIAHAIYRSRPIELLEMPLWRFYQYFLNFGFAFQPDDVSIPARGIPVLVSAALTILSVILLAVGRSTTCRARRFVNSREGAGLTPLLVVAIGMSLFVLAFSMIAWRRQALIACASVIPLMAVAGLWAGDRLWPWVTSLQRRLDASARQVDTFGFSLMLGTSPLLVLGVVHLIKPVLTDRGSIVFTPFLVACLACGLAALFARRAVGLAMAALVLVVHIASFVYYRAIPSPNDYRSLALQINVAAQRGDLVFVPFRDWVTSPLYFDLAVPHENLVAADYQAALAAHPGARVWVPLFSGLEPLPEMQQALSTRRVERELTAFRGRALLFVP